MTKSNILKKFWPKAVNCTVYILNRSLTLTVQNRTLKEAWNRRRLMFSYFKIFGCIAYAHIPYEKRKKLDDKGEKCVFLGVSDCSNTYKLYNPHTKNIIISRYIIFDEENFWQWNANGTTHHESALHILTDFDGKKDEEDQHLMGNQQ